jgi:WD40 repeat protein
MLQTYTTKDPIPTELQRKYIEHSRRTERNRTFAWIATGIAVIALSVLSYTTYRQSVLATNNAIKADQQAEIAKANAYVARRNEREARKAQLQAEQAKAEAEAAKVEAEKQEQIAEAQRSAARAQIYQTRPGELYTSTLLAIDSYLTYSSPEAEEVLRANISLLPVPVSQMKMDGTINELKFSRDGSSFVTASEDGSACVWNVADGAKRFCATSTESMNDAAFSPTADLLVVGDDAGVVQILNATNGDIQTTYEYGIPIWDVNIRTDGKLLAIARDDGRISIIDLNTRKESYSLQMNGQLVESAFSPNGAWIAAGSNAGSITLWNLTNGKIISGARHRGGITALEFSPNSRLLISGGRDNNVYVFDTVIAEELLRIPNEDWVEGIAFHPSGSWFVTVSRDKRIRLWDIGSGNERLRMLQDSFVQEVQVSSNGQWIATTGSDKTVRVWNAATGAQMFQIPIEETGSVLAFSNDGKYLVSGDQSGAVNTWDISVMPASKNYLQFSAEIRDIQFAPGADWVVASDENRVWLLTPEQLSTPTARPQGSPLFELKSPIRELAVSPDSNFIAVTTWADDLLIYDFTKRRAMTIPHTGSAYKLAFSADSTQLVTSNNAGTVESWDTSTGKLLGSLIENDSTVNSLATSSTLIAVGLTDRIALMDITGAKRLPDLETAGSHQALALSADGSLMAAGNSTGQVLLWSYENGEFADPISINKEPATSLSFSPTGDLLAMGTLNNVYLIDTKSGQEIARIPHANNVNAVSFSSDGSMFAAASSRFIQFWQVADIRRIESDQIVETACTRLVQNFGTSEWNGLFEGQPYKKLCESLPIPE